MNDSEIQALLEAATDGPWVSQHGEERDIPERSVYFVSTEDNEPETWQCVAECAFDRPGANAALIAAAPWAFAEVLRLRATLREIEQLPMSAPEARNALARLDLVILDVQRRWEKAQELEREAKDHVAVLGKVYDELYSIRRAMRPILDTSAPVDIR